MPLIMLLRMMLSRGLRMGIGQIMMTVGNISLVGFLFMITRFVKTLSIFVIFSGFAEVISRFFVMFVCHKFGLFLVINN